MKRMKQAGVALLAAASITTVFAQGLAPDVKAKVDAKVLQLQALSTDPAVVAAVKAFNTAPPEDGKAMTNDKWKSLVVLDPFVRSLTRNPLATFLKTKKDDQITEWFVSGADGTKVAFLAKTTSWSHRDKDKHKVPMSGKVWIGPVEVDESSGQQQVQIGLPVIDAGRPIGSMVVGLGISKLK